MEGKMIDKLTTAKVDGEWYLCEYHKTSKGIELRQAYLWEEDTSHKRVIMGWIAAQNLNELQTITLGKASGCAIKPLNKEQKRTLKVLWEDMFEVKRTAIPTLENYYFMKS